MTYWSNARTGTELNMLLYTLNPIIKWASKSYKCKILFLLRVLSAKHDLWTYFGTVRKNHG